MPKQNNEQHQYGIPDLHNSGVNMSDLREEIECPKHYTQGNIEVIDFIIDQKLDYCEGNVVKYICRHKHKGNSTTDLLKARQYIDFLLEKYPNGDTIEREK